MQAAKRVGATVLRGLWVLEWAWHAAETVRRTWIDRLG